MSGAPEHHDGETPGGASIPVLAAVIRRGDRYLVARRPAHKRHGGLWEFPGGKYRPGEGDEEAAARELREELKLGDAIRVGSPRYEARDPGSPFVIRFVEVEAEGDPVALEHDELRWCTAEELTEMELAPADAAFVTRRLRGTP